MNHSKTGQRLTIQSANMSGFQIPTVVQVIKVTDKFNSLSEDDAQG